jgi:serine/threonine protein kinase
MGEVYRARDPRLQREVAIKILPGLAGNDTDRLRRFEQEARAAGALNHPNILAVYDVGTHDGTPYLVTELLEGSSLRVRLTSGPLPPRKATDYAVQVAHGLAAAHDKGIVHRDLKPDNIFICRDGRAKILDFGLAKLTSPDAGDATVTSLAHLDHTGSGIVLGTAGYMSPEQVREGGFAVRHLQLRSSSLRGPVWRARLQRNHRRRQIQRYPQRRATRPALLWPQLFCSS